MLEILDGRQFGTLITLITVYALFGDDMRLWLTSKPSDNIFYGLSAVAFAVFAFEFMTNSCFRPGFASPPSFYFWLDLLATLSLLPEIGWIWDPVQSYLEGGGATTSADLSAQIRAGRAARAGSKAGRVVRIVRLIRLVRVFKLYKHCRRARHLRQAQRDADQQDVSEHAGLVANGTARESTVEQPPLGAKGKGSPVVVGSSRRSARVAPERVNSGELHHVPSMRRAKLLVGPSQGAAGQPVVVTPTHSALAAQRKTEGGPESKAVAGVALVPSEETFAAGTNPPSGSRWSARSMGSGDAASSYAAPRRLDVATALPLAAAPTALDAAIAAQSEDPNEADTGAEVSGKQAHTISNVGIVLSDLTIRRVILLILVMLFVVPFLSTLDVSPSKQILGGLAQLHRYPQDVNITEDEFRFNAQMYSRHAGRVIYLAVCPETSTGCKHSRHVAVVHDWLSEMSFDEDGNQPRFPNGTAASSPYGLLTNPITGWMPSMLLDSEATILSLYRTVEVQAYTTSGCFGLDADGRTADDPERGPCESVVWLDDSVLTRYEASLSFVRTWFVMFVISIGAALFTRDAELLVIRPIERMTALMTKLAADPLAEIQALRRDVFREAYDSDEDNEDDDDIDGEFDDEFDEDDEYMDHTEREGRYVCASLVNLLGGSAEDASKRAQGSYETAQLENAMIKIGGLLQVGFGEAGADIIAQNMGRGQGKLNPLVPGKRVDAIFGFCDIRRFTDATECLQEDVMVFVNTVGQLVHSATHRLGGAANKNIGDAFLLTWKLPRLLNPAEIASKGKDLLLQIQGTTRRDRRVSIDQFVDAMAHSGDAGVALSKLGVMGKQGPDQESRAWESRHPSDLYGEGMASQGRWVHDQFTSSTRVPFGSRGPSAAASLVLASPRRASVDGSATASSPVASELPHTGEMAAAAAGPGAGSARRHSLVPAEVEESMILEDEDERAAAPLGGHAAAAAASSGESSPVAGRVAPAAAGQHGAAGAWTKEASGTSHGSGWLDPTGGVGDGREDLTRATSACDMTSRDPELPPTGPPGAGPDSHAVAGDSIVDSEAVTESAGSNMPPAVVGSATANSIVARNTDPRAYPSGGASGPAGGTGRVSAASSGGASSSHPASDVVPPVRFLAKQQGGVATPAGVQVHGRSAARPAAAGARLSGGAAGAGDLPHRAQNAEVAGADGADKRPPDAPKLDVPHTRSASLGGGGEGARRSAAGDIAVSALRPSLLASADGIPKHSFSERVGGIGDASGGAVGRRLSMPTGFRHRMTRQSIIEPSAHKDLQHGAGITILDDPTAHAGFQPDAVAAGASSKAPLAIRDRDATARTADNALAAFLKVIVDIHNANKRGGVLYPFLRHRAIRRRFGKSFRVELGFGLHLGWAVEGAVGSAYKVDASYLSPHVNLAARLEALTKFYGVPLLISGNFARELSLDAQRYLRLIDRITVKGSRVPIELYTFDITQFPVEFGQLRLNTVARTSAERDANRLLHEDAIHIDFATDPSVLQLQADIPDAFFVSFHAAVRAYIRGDWPEAREQLVETEARYRGAGEDGPTQALLKTMDSLGVGEAKAAPADWKQVHVLDSKTG